MAFRYFESKEHASLYRKYWIRDPEEIHKLIICYLAKKKEKPFGLAVDVGCGSGGSTRLLATHFQKVFGIDISEAQIEEAKSTESPPNVCYLVAPAEKMPFEDASVDLVTASVAVHWFNMEEFMREVDRVLTPNGCLAFYSFKPYCDLYNKESSENISEVFHEVVEFLISEHGTEREGLMLSEYKDIFDAVHFEDKTRVGNISSRRTMSIAAMIGFVESICWFQTFLLKEPEAAKEFLQKVQERLLRITGTSSVDTELEMCFNYYGVFARKSDS